MNLKIGAIAAYTAIVSLGPAFAQDAAKIPPATPKGPMTFFLTSAGPGNGADLLSELSSEHVDVKLGTRVDENLFENGVAVLKIRTQRAELLYCLSLIVNG